MLLIDQNYRWKDSLLKVKEFKMLDDLMIGLYNLHKRSGELKRSMRCDAKTLGIAAYVLPKVTGTRFVGHGLNGVKVLLYNWTALGNSNEKEVVPRLHGDAAMANLVGYLKDLNDYRVRASAVMFKEMLSICSHLQ